MNTTRYYSKMPKVGELFLSAGDGRNYVCEAVSRCFGVYRLRETKSKKRFLAEDGKRMSDGSVYFETILPIGQA